MRDHTDCSQVYSTKCNFPKTSLDTSISQIFPQTLLKFPISGQIPQKWDPWTWIGGIPNALWAHPWLDVFSASNQEHRRISFCSPLLLGCERGPNKMHKVLEPFTVLLLMLGYRRFSGNSEGGECYSRRWDDCSTASQRHRRIQVYLVCSSGTVPSPRGEALVGLAPPNWNIKRYELLEFLSNLNVKPPCMNVKPPRTSVNPPYERLSGDGSGYRHVCRRHFCDH